MSKELLERAQRMSFEDAVAEVEWAVSMISAQHPEYYAALASAYATLAFVRALQQAESEGH